MTSSVLPSAGNAAKLSLQRALSAIRQHLNMDVAYLSQFDGNDSVFEIVDAPGLEELVKPGDRRSLDDIYCKHIAEGRLPELIPDTSKIPLARDMPITNAVPIGSHMSMLTTWIGTRNISQPMQRPLPNMARVFWCGVVPKRSAKARCAPGPW